LIEAVGEEANMPFSVGGGIRTISEIKKIRKDKMLVRGKTGERWVKLNPQAREILENRLDKLWDYNLDWISKTFSRCMFAMGIEDAIFHDLRRTFGYDLIRQECQYTKSVSY